jgi:hypothetical protein
MMSVVFNLRLYWMSLYWISLYWMSWRHRHIIKMDWLKARNAFLVVIINSTSGHKNIGSYLKPAHLLTSPACLVSLPALSACLPCQPACLVLCLQLVLIEMYFFQTNMHYSFLRYLCIILIVILLSVIMLIVIMLSVMALYVNLYYPFQWLTKLALPSNIRLDWKYMAVQHFGQFSGCHWTKTNVLNVDMQEDIKSEASRLPMPANSASGLVPGFRASLLSAALVWCVVRQLFVG